MLNKVTIVLEDTESGSVNLNMEFEPAAKDGEFAYPAQEMAYIMLDAIKNNSEIKTFDESVEVASD